MLMHMPHACATYMTAMQCVHMAHDRSALLSAQHLQCQCAAVAGPALRLSEPEPHFKLPWMGAQTGALHTNITALKHCAGAASTTAAWTCVMLTTFEPLCLHSQPSKTTINPEPSVWEVNLHRDQVTGKQPLRAEHHGQLAKQCLQEASCLSS